MLLVDGMTLYHGSYMIVSDPDLSKCKEGKDFGRGFYVTTSLQQAERFAGTSVKKAVSNRIISKDSKIGYVSSFTYKHNQESSIYEFEDADPDWLHCVVTHRRPHLFPKEVFRWKEYDILCGKIANDNTNLVITAYMDGLYGSLFSHDADMIAIHFLEPENLKNQVCFRTESVMKCLQFIEGKEVRL